MAEKAKKMQVEVDGGVLRFTFLTTPPTIVAFDFDTLTPEVQHRTGVHGLEQILRDAGAGKDNTAADCMALAQKRWETMSGGVFVARREAGAPKEEASDILARAIVLACETAGKPAPSFEAAKAKVEALDRSARAKLRNAPSVAAALAKVKEQSDAPLDAFIA